MKYCEPWNAGLASEPCAIARRLTRLLNALSDEITDHVVKGELPEELRQLRLRMFDKLRAEGWRISLGDRGWKVLQPKD